MKFSGIPEDKDKSGLITEKKIRDLFIEKLKLKYVGEIDFHREKVKLCYNPLRLGTVIVLISSGTDFVNTPRLYSD